MESNIMITKKIVLALAAMGLVAFAAPAVYAQDDAPPAAGDGTMTDDGSSDMPADPDSSGDDSMSSPDDGGDMGDGSDMDGGSDSSDQQQ